MDQIISNIGIIVDEGLTWKTAVERFNINEGNLQRLYIRYIIKEYGEDEAFRVVSNL
jgi:hypothetical protein